MEKFYRRITCYIALGYSKLSLGDPYKLSRQKTGLQLMLALMALILNFSTAVNAQQSSLTCTNVLNATTPWIEDGAPKNFDLDTESDQGGLAGWGGSVGNTINLSTTDKATLTFVAAGSGRLRVKNVNTAQIYTAGDFAGFKVGVAGFSLSLLESIVIKTFYNDGVTTAAADTYSGANLASVSLGSNTYVIGFNTKKPFNQVEINYAAVGAGSFDVYYAVLQSYCAAANDLVCNTKTAIVAPTYPAVINPSRTGVEVVSGVAVLAVTNTENVVDNTASTAASITAGVGVGVSKATVSVRDLVSQYPAGTYAGYEISNSSVLSLGLLSNLSFQTYLDDVPVQTVPGSSLLVSAALLSGSGKQTVGFVATAAFDEVQIIFTRTTNVSLGTTQIYNLVLRSFCENTTALACNTITNLNETTDPVFINTAGTGVTGTLGVNNQVVNVDRLLDSDISDPASILLTAGVATTGSISVKKQLSDFPINSFIGFDISRPSLAGVGILQGITVATYKGGNATPVETFSDVSGLASVNSSVLAGDGRRTVGFIPDPTKPFDEIRLIITQPVSVTLGTTFVYAAVIEKFCAFTGTLACNTATNVTNPDHPVFVDGENTGIEGTACVGCSINGAQNVVDANTSNFAEITLTTGVLTDASFAVANALQTYNAPGAYAGVRYAGFDIATGTILSANILASSVTLSLFNDGTLVPGQTFTGTDLLVGATTSILDGTYNRRNIGIIAGAGVQFDEVKITFHKTVGVDLGIIRIYNSFVSKACPTTVVCNNTYFLSNTAFPVFINWSKTGSSGVAVVGNGVEDAENVVSPSTTDYATIKLNVDAISAGTIAVKDVLRSYPTGTTVGFKIQTLSALVDLNLLSAITISTYLDGVPKDSKSGSDLLSLNLLGLVNIGVNANRYDIGFQATTPFNEVRITVANLVAASVIFGETRVFGAFVDTHTSIGGDLVCNVTLNPDFNVTLINVPVPGNVNTNDRVPANTQYGTPVPSVSNPAGGVLTLAADGTYSFVSTSTGVYTYAVPVCVPEGDVPCPTVPLVITVKDATLTTNPPIANVDIASVKGDPTTPASVTISVKTNDKPGNAGGSLVTSSDSPKVTVAPAHGVTSVSGNNITYTPNAGYYGKDIFTYQVCETTGGTTRCADAQVEVTVLDPSALNSTEAADDYVSTGKNTTVTGNVLTNDSDPENDLQTVTAYVLDITGKGKLTLATDGGYTFVPANGYEGPVDFTYTAKDSQTPPATASATLHILVQNQGSLPVTLADFTVRREGTVAQLNWSTTEESNSQRFDIERSKEGRVWNVIGSRASSGKSVSVKPYSFADAAPLTGENLYRLKMVDQDGTFAYSIIRSLIYDGSSTSVYPNPVANSENLQINVQDWSKVKSVRVVNMNGKTVFESVSPLKSGISTRNFAAGLYLIQVTQTNGTVASYKVVKQ